MPTQHRFQLETNGHAGGSKKFSRAEFVLATDAHAMVNFLGKLATLFGPPHPVEGGFSYAIHDVDGDVSFTAYSAESGPSYGAGVNVDRELLRPSIVRSRSCSRRSTRSTAASS